MIKFSSWKNFMGLGGVGWEHSQTLSVHIVEKKQSQKTQMPTPLLTVYV